MKCIKQTCFFHICYRTGFFQKSVCMTYLPFMLHRLHRYILALPKVGVQNVILYTRIAERKKMISYFSDYTLVFGKTRLYRDFSDFREYSTLMPQHNHIYSLSYDITHHLWLQMRVTCFETGRKSVLLRMKGIIHTMRVKLGVFSKKLKNKAQIYAGFSTCIFMK